MDALSDALRVLRLTGAMFLDAEFTEPWCIISDPRGPRSPMGSSPGIVFFHVLIEGRCKSKLIEDGQTIELAAGDLLMLPRGSRHLMGSDLHLAPAAVESMVKPGAGMLRIDHGGGGGRTRFVCGYLNCDERLCGQMLDALPRMLRVPLGDGSAAGWVQGLLAAGTQESAAARPGSETMLAKLSELLFVEALRRYIEILPEQQTGWLAGLRDRFVGRALALLRQRRARQPDGLGQLLHRPAVLRAQRFTEFLGQPPMQYLTR